MHQYKWQASQMQRIYLLNTATLLIVILDIISFGIEMVTNLGLYP
jgi:hypothetical protein